MNTGTGTVLAAVGVVTLGVIIALPGGTSDDPDGTDVSSGDHRINLVAYSVPKPGFEAVIAGYRQTEEGKDTGFAESYGASGDQSRKVARRVPADLVNFSLEPDITRLVKEGLVAGDWKEGVPGDESGRSVPFGSVVSFVTRAGNPRHLENWDDLLAPGIEIITPNPASSGSAKWNLLAPYAGWYFAALDRTHDPAAAHAEALAKVTDLVNDHIHTRPTSGREATSAFEQGQGDVLLSYENEAIMLARDGQNVTYLNPSDTFRIENPVAVVTGDGKDAAGDDTAALSFRDYLFTGDAETRWASQGFRPGPDLFGEGTPVIDSLPADQREDFRPTRNIWTIDDLSDQFVELFPDAAAGDQGKDNGKTGWPLVDAVLFGTDGAITRIYGGGA